MLGGKNTKPLGYTIIEVMIVLAVSGVMFVIAANFINGKAARTAFSQGVNETASRIQGAIEQVTDGQYSDIPFNCTAASSSGVSLSFSAAGSSNQGANSQCVFIGKFFHLSNAGDRSGYEVFSLAAARSANSLLLNGVKPVYNPAGGVDLTIQQTIPQHLEISSTAIKANDGVTSYTVYGFGFAQSQGTAGLASGTYASGAQTVNLIYSGGLTDSTSNTSTAAGALTGPGRVLPAQSVEFCLTDDTRYARILIGSTSNSNQLSVRVRMNGTTAC